MSEDIAGKKLLQEYHSVLFKLSGIITDFVTETGCVHNLCPQDHFNPICNLIRKTESGSKLCAVCDKTMEKCKATGESIVYECHAGFIDIIVPLFVNKKFIGCLTAGQILNKKTTETSFNEFLEKTPYLKVERKRMRELYFATKVLTQDQIEALVELLRLFGNYIVESENKMLFLESIKEKNRTSEARKYIEKNYQKKITVLDIARAVYQSESYFSHQFKEETGVSAIKYLNRYRIEKAKELLLNSKLTITEVAFNTGFQNLTHFNRIFRANTQKSPREYKKQKR